MRSLVLICVLTMTAELARGQRITRGSWSDVTVLVPGEKVEIHPFSGGRLRGRFRSTTTDTLVVETGKGDQTLNRSDIREVKRRRASGRLRNAGIGAAVGGGIAAGVVAIGLRGDLDDSLAVAILAVLAAAGASVGFALGMIPAAYNTVYRAEKN